MKDGDLELFSTRSSEGSIYRPREGKQQGMAKSALRGPGLYSLLVAVVNRTKESYRGAWLAASRPSFPFLPASASQLSDQAAS